MHVLRFSYTLAFGFSAIEFLRFSAQHHGLIRLVRTPAGPSRDPILGERIQQASAMPQ